jgi:uncharacterized protein
VSLGDIADRVTRQLEMSQRKVHQALFEPVVRLGVTGLSRAGKTVFITSLVANLLDRGRMPGLGANSAIEAAFLQPQPDDTVARFDYESHLAALSDPEPHWPQSTRAVSQLRLSLKVRPGGILGALSGPRTLHVDIVDYPGEWLLDLALMERSYADWSKSTLARIRPRESAMGYNALSDLTDSNIPHDEATARSLAESFTGYLHKARARGYSDCTPGRFILPGDLAGSPALTFAPLARPERPGRGSLWREMERRYNAYKSKIVKPFFRDHFARIDRQVVLVDVLEAIHTGPKAVEDLRQTMADILTAFRPGRNAFLTQLLRGRRVEKILFAASKADHLHHLQHPRLSAVIEAMLRDARDRADFAGAESRALSIAAMRATTEEEVRHDGHMLPCVRGRLATGQQAALYPGELPEDPAHLLGPARAGAGKWLDTDYEFMRFEPARLCLKPGEGPPHIRMDQVAEFLIGDKLR